MPPGTQPLQNTTLRPYSHMMRSFWKYGLLFRIFGILFISGFYDRSLENARVKFLSPYLLCPTAWISVGLPFEAAFIGSRVFLTSGSVRSFTKSLLFIIHTIVMVKTLTNSICAFLGTSKLLDFLKESAAYEQSVSYVPPVDADMRKRKLSCATRRIAVLVVGAAASVLIVQNYLKYLVQEYGEKWRVLLVVWGITSTITFFVYDSIMHIVLTRTSDVIADYLHHQALQLLNVSQQNIPRQARAEASHRIEEIRLNLSRITGLIRLIDNVWHSAAVTSSACLIFLVCITLYAVLSDGFADPVVKIAICYSLFSLCGLVDVAAVSQALVDEVRPCASPLNNVFLSSCGNYDFTSIVCHLGVSLGPSKLVTKMTVRLPVK
ncbi:hypothetical protein HPB48_009246 [Haemaphysalis longicornis]|uniref:Gustatory receptor n=1 Tax=Haemaphysalis longicornis TaxID=44386 RepID=A0A9J6GNU8_HAELO|nr:hypothetical protein HPB48_009246 [Haemaphysalis longicornis]